MNFPQYTPPEIPDTGATIIGFTVVSVVLLLVSAATTFGGSASSKKDGKSVWIVQLIGGFVITGAAAAVSILLVHQLVTHNPVTLQKEYAKEVAHSQGLYKEKLVKWFDTEYGVTVSPEAAYSLSQGSIAAGTLPDDSRAILVLTDRETSKPGLAELNVGEEVPRLR